MKGHLQSQLQRTNSKGGQSGQANSASIHGLLLIVRSQNCIDRCRERSAFSNPARNDGLILRHWKRREDTAVAALATPADSNVASEMDVDDKEKPVKVEPDYPYAKFNVKVNVPEYTQEQYDVHLKSDGWSKEETDYLVSLALEFDLRWVVIWDRYEYQPSFPPKETTDPAPSTPQPPSRTMEDLKARYYDIAAKTMALHQPLSSMSTTEFSLHEKMLKFDATLEATRKKLAETLFARSPDEVKEEELLLTELKRIVASQEKFAQERKDLYDRLSVPPSTAGGATYKTSQELLQLMQTLLSADKNKKRRSLAGAEASNAGPASGTPPSTAHPDRTHRQSITSATADKRSSLPTSAGASNQKQLSAREEAKYGIAHNDRSQTGTQFRHERINKLAQAKSNVLSQKIAAALTELGIPTRLSMPTAGVCDEFERLVGSVHVLLDVRKVGEKLENEIRVARAEIEERDGGGGGQGKVNGEGKEQEAKGLENGEEDAEGEEDNEEGEKEVEIEDEAAEKEAEDEEMENDDDDEEAVEEKDGIMADAKVEDEDEDEADNDEGDKEEDKEAEEEDEEVQEEDSTAAPARSESIRKRSASVVSHLSSKSTRSTKRQKK